MMKPLEVKVLTFRLTSSSRSDMMVTFSEAYTVEPSWDDSVISFTLDENDLVFDEFGANIPFRLQSVTKQIPLQRVVWS